MTKTNKLVKDGQKLALAISELEIRKAHFALFCRRTTVMMSAYINGRESIPFWMWDKIDSLRAMPLAERRARILGMNPSAKLLGMTDEEQAKIKPIKA